MRDLVRLICTECKEENYYTDKNKKLNPEKAVKPCLNYHLKKCNNCF